MHLLFIKGRNVSCKAFTQIMNNTHTNNFIHINIWKLIPHKKAISVIIQLCSATLSCLPFDV